MEIFLLIFFTLFLIPFVKSFGIPYFNSNQARSRKVKTNLELVSRDDFTVSQFYLGEDGRSGIAIDGSETRIALPELVGDEGQIRVINYNDILSSELYIDGETVTKTERGSQIGGALIGGIMFGGVGAVIGGLSGSKRSADEVRNIDLRLIVRDSQQPVHDVKFLDGKILIDGKTNKRSNKYKESLSQARHWHGLIEVLIRTADKEDAKKEITQPFTEKQQSSVADELLKLSQLLQSGVLSEEEFKAQKQKLLS